MTGGQIGNYFHPPEKCPRFRSQAAVRPWRPLPYTAGSLSICFEANNYDQLRIIIPPWAPLGRALNPTPGPSLARLKPLGHIDPLIKRSNGPLPPGEKGQQLNSSYNTSIRGDL